MLTKKGAKSSRTGDKVKLNSRNGKKQPTRQRKDLCDNETNRKAERRFKNPN